jgi:hypothetical protein
MKASRLLEALALSAASSAFAAGPAPTAAPAHRAPLADHLARTEASVRALDRHLAAAAARNAGKSGDAKLVERARKLGRRHAKEPLAWSEYVRKVPGVVDVTAYQSEAAQKDAEKAAADLGDDLDALWARRKKMEAERMVLWSKIAFRAVADRELSDQPLYRFELKAQAGKVPEEQRMEALRAAAQFVRVVDHLANQAQEAVDSNPDAVFEQWHKLLAAARGRLQDKMLSQADLALDVYKATTDAGKLSAAAKSLSDLGQTILDAEQALAGAEKAEDDEEADASRAQLQQALADTAGAVAALDGAIGRAAIAWGVSVVPGTKAAVGELPDLAVTTVVARADPDVAAVMKAVQQAAEDALKVIRGMGLSNKAGGWPRFMRDQSTLHAPWNEAIAHIQSDVEAIKRGDRNAIEQFHLHIGDAENGLVKIGAENTDGTGTTTAAIVPDLQARLKAIDSEMTTAEKTEIDEVAPKER